MSIVNGIITAALLGPTGKGDYYLVVLLAATIVVLLQLGLKDAFSYFAAQGRTRWMVTRAVVLVVPLSAAGLAITIALLPWIRETFIRGPDLPQIAMGLIAVPIALSATFTTAIVVGRQAVRWNLMATLGTSLSSTALIVWFVGFQSMGVDGALIAYLVTLIIQATIYLIGARRVTVPIREATSARFRDLFRYGLPLFPGALTSFFSHRFDVLLMAWLVTDASTAIGLYSMAVSMAGLVFWLPNATASLFFPHVAGSSRADADRQTPRVTRITLLVTSFAALTTAVGSVVLILVVLPEFVASIPALFILLPGVVALSVGQVVEGYIAGVGRTGTVSIVNLAGFALNTVLNLVLLPTYGINGAAMASLISYSATGIAYTAIAARSTRTSIARFWVPGIDDVRFSVSVIGALGRRVIGRSSAGA
jgi:O-antigen/teichoic acid export membrane protein